MAGSRIPSGSLRNHASNATKSRTQIFTKAEPKIKKDTFVGDSSDDSSSDSDSDSGSDAKNESAVDFHKRVSTPSSSKVKTNGAKAKDDIKVFKTATPAKSPTINGLAASALKSKKLSAKPIKKEDTSSASESGSDSDSESSKDEKTKAKGKLVKSESTSDTGSESDTSSASESESESASESDKFKKAQSKSPTKSLEKAPSPVKKVAKPAAKAKALVKGEASPESETSSADDESESEDSDSDSEDPSQQIEEQIRNDLKSAKSHSPQAQAEEPSKKKTKRTKSLPEDEDGDIEMMDQSMALTNGGTPANANDVPEFVAPDFHLRKLEGDSNAADVAKLFSKAQLEGKQVWYITAPASLPVTVVQDLSIPMDKAQQGLPVLSHDGDDYHMAFDNPTASSSFRLLIPNKKGNDYTLLERPVNQTMHFTRSETFPPEGPSSVITTQTISTSKPARPQPEGLRARYTPLGVPAPKPTTALPNKAAAASTATEDAISTPRKQSSKKRKHTDDGEDGSVATAITTTPVPTQKKDPNPNKNPPAEKSAKKQKTSRDATPRKETPVPVPQPQISSSSSSSSSSDYSASKAKQPSTSSASQPLPRVRRSTSPGAALPVTQVPTKLTPIPVPALPAFANSDGLMPTSREAIQEREKQAKKAERQRKKAEKEAEKEREKQAKKAERQRKKAEKEAEEERKKAGKEAAWAARSPRKVSMSQIPPPRFDSSGRPMF